MNTSSKNYIMSPLFSIASHKYASVADRNRGIIVKRNCMATSGVLDKFVFYFTYRNGRHVLSLAVKIIAFQVFWIFKFFSFQKISRAFT